MQVFQVIQFILLLIIIAYLIYYAYTLLFEKNYQPIAWKKAVKEGKIPKELLAAEKKYRDKDRFFNFWFQVERVREISGDFAELGVYKGDSAFIIHQMDSKRKFHLFDTFEGFTEKDLSAEEGKAATYTKHNFADTSLETVMRRLHSEQFVFYKGYFPDTAKKAENTQFVLVNMDADLYKPTKAGLEFFYPRLVPGGVIIVHDYNPDWPGIMQAVNEFTENIPEPIIPLPDRDSTVMILKGK